jgi:hypothetical protein
MKCIYCGKTDEEVTFEKVEHVMPRLMGSFSNLPTLVDLVCDICNGDIFSPLENRFKEDTEEGIFYQMFNFSNSAQIRVKGNNISATFASGIGKDDFFNEVFPFFDFQENEWRIVVVPQIKIKRYGNNGYIVLLIEKLRELSDSKLRSIQRFVKGVQSQDVRIFAGASAEGDTFLLEESITKLRALGIDYQEGERRYEKLDNTKERHFGIQMEGNVNDDIVRVLTKIAFNYFALCAINSDQEDLLHHDNFFKIKQFILGQLPLKTSIQEFLVEVQEEGILYHEQIQEVRYVAHQVVFCCDISGRLISEVSFVGRKVYKIFLGNLPKGFQRDDFGSGHLFDPAQHRCIQLTQNPTLAGRDIFTGFGLYNRI